MSLTRISRAMDYVTGERAARAFDIYIFAVYLMMAVGQGAGFSERYGLVVLTATSPWASSWPSHRAGSASWLVLL